MNYQCPKCRSESIRKVSEIYNEGMHTGTTSHQRYGTSMVTTVSAAARDAAPPSRMGVAGVFFSLKQIAMVFFGIPIGLYIDFTFDRYPSNFFATVYFLILASIYISIVVKNGKKVRHFNFNVYPEQYAKWQTMWKCNRCGEYFFDEDMEAA